MIIYYIYYVYFISVYDKVTTSLYKNDPPKNETLTQHELLIKASSDANDAFAVCIRLMENDNPTNSVDDLRNAKIIYDDKEIFDESCANLTIAFMTKLEGYDVYKQFLEDPGKTREGVYGGDIKLPDGVDTLQDHFQRLKRTARQ
jgi:hypothetical protein